MSRAASVRTTRSLRSVMVVTSLAWSSLHASAAADVGSTFLDQPHDFQSFLPSEVGTRISSARAADDFFFFLTNITSIEVEMIVSFPNAPEEFRVDIFEDANGVPGDVVLSFHDPIVTDLGKWNGRDDLHHLSLFFHTDAARLRKGMYWLSPYAIGNGSDTDRAFWGTSNFGDPDGAEGLFLSDELGFPDWTGVSHPDLLGSPSDFAMRLEGILPAPGALGLLGLGLVAGRTRRRQ